VWIDPTGLCWTGLDTLQAALDVGGLIPGFGEPLDLINAGISAARGNWGDAGLSALGAVPFVGWAGTAGKGAKYANKAGDLAATLNKVAKKKGAGQRALRDLAKGAKRTGGVTPEEGKILKGWAKENEVPARGPEAHARGGPHARRPHYHVGSVDHIPEK